MKKRLVSLFIIGLLLLGGCAAPQEGKPPVLYAFGDDTGNVVGFTQQPQKVAVLDPTLAAVWELAGGEVAIREEGDMDRLIADRPDFVIGSAKDPHHLQMAARLQEAKIPFGLFEQNDFEDYLRFLQICTDITGDSEAYMTHGVEVQETIDGIKKKYADHEPPSVLLLRADGTSATPLAAEQHPAAVILEDLGAENIASAENAELQTLLQEDPACILILPAGETTQIQTHLNGLLPASLLERVAYLDQDLFGGLPVGKWANAYETMAKLLYKTS